ncbi:MAG: PD40 domain-containing protein [Acidobacteria bacterium]|nr:PD40 domain-containing protein [Acidobacteriota bacterium]
MIGKALAIGAVGLLMSMGPAIARQAAQGQPRPAQPPRFASEIRIFDLATKISRVVYKAEGIWEAPNWSRDGAFLLSNSGGRLYRILADGTRAPEPLPLDPSLRANNDHDFTRDGKWLAISATAPGVNGSQIFVAHPDATNHRAVVTTPPSYFHGWSPDGKWLSFVANRDKKQYDVYRVPFEGGPEERLTMDPANDDGTDYSPDGKWIYFNSQRGGGWNIWRMPSTGAGPNDERAERVTDDEFEDWFPHPSPDGTSLIFLSFPAGTKTHDDRNLAVWIRMIPMPGDVVGTVSPVTVVTLTGGQGTINVNSWAPDSRRFAYVSYIDRQPQ